MSCEPDHPVQTPVNPRPLSHFTAPLRSAGLLCLLLVARSLSADPLPAWQLEGSREPVYLLGSMHLLRPGDETLSEEIRQLADAVDVIYMELDLDNLDPVETASTMLGMGMSSDGRSLPEILGPDSWQEVEASLAQLEIDPLLIQAQKPWLAALTVTQLRLAQLGFGADVGVEQQVLRAAGQNGTPVQGLETLEQQLEALDKLSQDAQKEFLLNSLSDAEDLEEQVDEMVRAWASGDVEELDRVLLGDLRESPEVYETVLLERNRRWAGQLEQVARARRAALVVVGTGHLIGEDSVPDLLERQGYPSRQLERRDLPR